jgi:hypothetical protein
MPPVPNLGQLKQAPPIRKIELPPAGSGTHLDAQPGPAPGTVVLQVFDQARGDVYLILCSSLYAGQLANELLAPSVAAANGNGAAAA